jgi:transcriptional regulator with XRE-family HTH domain
MPVMDIDDAVRLAVVRQALASGEARRRRQAAGLSLADVAGVIHVERATVGLWETGARVPRPAVALRYAELLHRLEQVQQMEAS